MARKVSGQLVDCSYSTFRVPTPRVFGMASSFDKLKRAGVLYRMGFSQMQICRMVGLSAYSVHTFLSRSGLLRPKKSATPREWEFKPQGSGSRR